MDTTDAFTALFDRVEKEGVACSNVKDGHVLIFTSEMLRRLLADAETKGEGKVVVFVRRSVGHSA